MMSQVEHKINLVISGPFIERLSWERVGQALCEHWPFADIEPLSVRIARNDGDEQKATKIISKNLVNYQIHRRKMDIFWRAFNDTVGKFPVPTNAVLEVVDGGEFCLLTFSNREKNITIQVPPPIDLERLINPRERNIKRFRPLKLTDSY
jgi:hypothetical protein